MKKAHLSYHRNFPESPVNWSARVSQVAYRCTPLENGRVKKPGYIRHPALDARKLWCLLRVEVNGVELRFSFPAELDLVIRTFSQKPMPSRTTRQIHGDYAASWNRPSRTWFSRLPAKAKSAKWREVFLAYVAREKTVQEFRDFYADNPPIWDWEGGDEDNVFSRFHEARRFHFVTNYPEKVVM